MNREAAKRAEAGAQPRHMPSATDRTERDVERALDRHIEEHVLRPIDYGRRILDIARFADNPRSVGALREALATTNVPSAVITRRNLRVNLNLVAAATNNVADVKRLAEMSTLDFDINVSKNPPKLVGYKLVNGATFYLVESGEDLVAAAKERGIRWITASVILLPPPRPRNMDIVETSQPDSGIVTLVALPGHDSFPAHELLRVPPKFGPVVATLLRARGMRVHEIGEYEI